MPKCELCGQREATWVCVRCRRYVCQQCLDEKMSWLCKDCGEFRRAVERDRMRTADYIQRMVRELERRIGRPECSRCPLARELALSLLKMVRDLRREAVVEGFERLASECEGLERRILTLVLGLLVRQGIAVSPT